MNKNHSVLIISNDNEFNSDLQAHFKLKGWQHNTALSGNVAIEYVRVNDYALIILDSQLPDIDSIELLKLLQSIKQNPVIMSSEARIKANILENEKSQIFGFITKPIDSLILENISNSAAKYFRLESDYQGIRNILLDENMPEGDSTAVKELRQKLKRIGQSDSRVSILGESGAGKTRAARYIHQLSERASGPFFILDCRSLGNLNFETFLLGGSNAMDSNSSFSAVSEKGKMALAHRGTLVLKEVGALNLDQQSILLKSIEFHAGLLRAKPETKLDVRIISTSSENLQEKTRRGIFREDLYFRLNVIPVYMPSLRNRISDISIILQSIFRKSGLEYIKFNDSSIIQFQEFHWPGNISQLEYFAHLIILKIKEGICGDEAIEQLIGGLNKNGVELMKSLEWKGKSYRDRILQLERMVLESAISDCGGNITRAAQALKMDRGNLSKKLKSLSIHTKKS